MTDEVEGEIPEKDPRWDDPLETLDISGLRESMRALCASSLRDGRTSVRWANVSMAAGVVGVLTAVYGLAVIYGGYDRLPLPTWVSVAVAVILVGCLAFSLRNMRKCLRMRKASLATSESVRETQAKTERNFDELQKRQDNLLRRMEN